jgi:hypothetical protein
VSAPELLDDFSFLEGPLHDEDKSAKQNAQNGKQKEVNNQRGIVVFEKHFQHKHSVLVVKIV